jgi:hypothetical protein
VRKPAQPEEDEVHGIRHVLRNFTATAVKIDARGRRGPRSKTGCAASSADGLREDAGVEESEPTADVISRQEAASLVVRLAQALDQTSDLLEATAELHRKVVELHAALAEPLVDLERLLAEAQTQTPKEPE